MKSPALPPDEVSRLHELRDFQLLDTSPESSLDDLTALAAQICDAPIALISLVDEHRQWFKSCLGLDFAETSREHSFCGHTILQPDLFLIPDAAQDERFAGNPLVLGDPHIRFYAGAPLVSPAGHALGTLCVMDRVPRQLTGPQQQALVTLARQVMQHFGHRRQSRRLLESESLLGILTEHIRAGLFILDRERRYLYASQAYAEIVRLPLAAILGRSPKDLMPDLYETGIRPHLDRAYAGERVHFESTRPGPQGQHHYSVTYEPRTEAGQVAYVVGVILDITDRKAAETDSERQRAELQLILDTVPALVFYKDRDSRFLRVNRQLARLAKVSPEDFIGKSDAEMGSPKGAKYRQDDLQVMTSGEPLRQLEERIHTADGIRWLLTDKLPYRDEQGRITGIVGFSVDITARKFAQEAMLRTQADLQLALDAARLGRWDWNIVTNEVHWSPQCLAHYGLPPETPMDYARFLSLIHPEDRAQVEAALHAAVQNRSSYESEKRVIWKDGSVHWTASRGQVYRNQAGEPVRLTGVTFDITERKQAETALRLQQLHAQSLLQFSRKLEHAESYREIMQAARAAIEATLGFKRVWFYQLSDDSQQLRLISSDVGDSAEPPADEGQRLLVKGDRMLEEIVASGEIVVVEDAQTDPRTDKAIASQLGSRTIINVPVTLAGKRLGSIGTGTFGAEGIRRLSPPEQEFLLSLASHMAAVIDRVSALAARRQAELELRAGEELLRTVTNTAQVGLVIVDREHRYRYANPAYAHILRLPTHEIVGQLVADVLPQVYTGQIRPHLELAFRGENVRYELALACPDEDQRLRYYAVNYEPDRASIDQVVVVVIVDITERKLAELAVQQSESSLQEAQRLAKLGKWEWHSRTDLHVWSPEIFEMYGREPRLGPAKVPEVARYFTPESWARLSAAVNAALADGTAYECDAEVVRPDGRPRWITARGEIMRDNSGQIIGLRGTVQDITARKQSETALHEALERFETLAKATNDAVWDWDLLTDEVWWNEGFHTLFGHHPGETMRTVDTWVAFLHPEERDRVVGDIQAAIDRGDRTWVGEYRFRRKDGTYAHVLDRGYILHDEQGKPVRMIGAMQDITARKQAEIQLRESEERFRQLAENINEVFWISDPEKNQLIYVSPAYEKIWGLTCDSLYQAPRTWFDSIHPEDRQRVMDAALHKQVTGEYDEVYRISRPDGSRRWIHDRAFPIRHADGRVHRIVGTAEDISARRQLEEQFRQAQKMEAIGQLAGGVAHDFNNILAAIMMQTDLSASEQDLAGEVPEGLREIRALAERAANLTRQLLLFSRKQVMHTRDLDLNEAVTGLFKMLQRIIGEHFSVQYNLHTASLIVRADPGMLDQVLLNLVVNARDAMPKGGRIIIKTFETQFSPEEAALIPDAAPGRYCCLCVQDSGCGIPPENLHRIFEPFFTTKGQGKGTGLGLATVFGIVKQHGGFVRVESQVGHGTTFQILLPAAPAAAAAPESKPAKTTPRGGTETILLVEDEHSVRLVTRILLERAGYKVLEAANGAQALQLWEQHPEPIHLLFTDVVMPGGMDGRELAVTLEARNPRLKVILTSGYSAELAGREIDLKESQTFLQKPAASHLVLQAVRHALDH